ncbi:hypothetical protein [Thermococcus barossii]|uniref:Uncharacterized protein n=1 Tax=Thermococcus barossii TaxID=54077 RepID=A0A2Z2MKP2_9EURY|nr:hypothetical protein [Thermococcus barossii]ASJ05305.1 hypothetical protein A3L01_07990 [Thermococcus barossii]
MKMLRLCTVLIVFLLLAPMLARGEVTEPYVRSPPGDSELTSLNLKLVGWEATTLGSDGASTLAEYAFACRDPGRQDVYNTELWMGYFDDAGAEKGFYEEVLSKWASFKDEDEVKRDSDGEPYSVTHYRYTIDETGGSSDFVWAIFRRVATYECLSSGCESWVQSHPDESIRFETMVEYIVASGPYVIRARGYYYDGFPCDIEGALPALINHYLNTIPGNKVSIPLTGGPGAPSGGSEVAAPTTSGTGEAHNGDSGFERPGVILSPEAKARMNETLGKLEGLSGGNIEVVRIKTPEGELVKVINRNGKASGTALSFRLKYYGNKYVLDRVVDGSMDKLNDLLGRYAPGLNLFKDYVKAFKDSGLFQGEDAVKKTALDLHVDERSASLYNDMSGIEGRELKLSPAKNAAPSSTLTKPFEDAIQAMGVAVKKAVAQDYEWEFRKTAERAVLYKKAGLKYSEIIRNTVSDVTEETSQSRRVQTLNAQSKEGFRDQEARIRFYINKLFEEGVI